MLEFDHTDRARHALTTLQLLSPRPFHCLLIPVNLRADARDVNDPESPGYKEIWDVAVAGVIESCDVREIDKIAPKVVPDGYYTDLLLVSDSILEKMQQDPNFAAAQARRQAVANQSCSYTNLVSTDLGFCDMLCHNFASLNEAQRQCNLRPSCKKVLSEFGHFELRGGARPYGPLVAKGYLKQQCKNVIASEGL